MMLFLPLVASAQNTDWILHGKGIGTSPVNSLFSHHMAKDAAGNIYLTGAVTDSMEFGPFTIHGTELIPGVFLNSFYIAKLNPAGEPQWVKTFLGQGILTLADIAVDPQGDFYIVGNLSGIMLLDTIRLESNFTAGDMILAKFNSDGEIQWASMSESQPGFSSAAGHAVALGPDNKVVIAGTIDNHVIFEGIELDVSENLFLASYNDDGTINWVRAYGAIHPLQIDTEIAVDANQNIYWVGQTSLQSATVSVFDTVSLLPSLGETFIGKFNEDGNVIWFNHYGGNDPNTSSRISARNLVLDPSDNSVVIAGIFTDTVSIGNTTLTEPSILGNHLFLAKFNTQGGLQWAKQSHGIADRILTNDLSITDNGDLFVAMGAASSQGLSDLTLGEGSNRQSVTINGALNGVLAKYNSNGALDWMKGISGFDESPIQTVLATGPNTAVIGGFFKDQIQLGSTILHSSPQTYSSNSFFASCKGGLTASREPLLAPSSSMRLFPNPSSASVTVQWEGDRGLDGVQVFDQTGRLVYSHPMPFPQNRLELSLPDVPKGIYNVKAWSGQAHSTQRLILE